jgi:tetratricopeptide (TPR) repeat protein
MVGISMDADALNVQDSLRSLFNFISKDGAKHGVDAERLGVYAASANVTQTSIFLMNENAPKGIKAAVLYYGGAPPMRPRVDLPVLFVVAEGDMPQFGPALPGLWQRILETKAPWTLQIASRLPHAFDAFEDSDESRRVIQQTIGFWKSHLEPVPQPSWKPSEDRAIVSALYWNDPAKAIPLLTKYLEKNPNDATAVGQYARMLQFAQRFDEAVAAFDKMKTLDPNNPQSYAGIGQIRFTQRRYDERLPCPFSLWPAGFFADGVGQERRSDQIIRAGIRYRFPIRAEHDRRRLLQYGLRVCTSEESRQGV